MLDDFAVKTIKQSMADLTRHLCFVINWIPVAILYKQPTNAKTNTQPIFLIIQLKITFRCSSLGFTNS